MSAIWDLAPVSGSIIWVKQIDRQLSMYLRRVEDVLGTFNVNDKLFSKYFNRMFYFLMNFCCVILKSEVYIVLNTSNFLFY